METVNFREQADIFLRRLAARKRNPVKPSTISTYGSRLTAHILPLIGDVPLESFANGTMKDFAQRLGEKGLGSKTILEVVGVVKAMMASAVDGEGNRLYPRVWNHEFIDLPSLGAQKRPSVTPEQLAAAVKDKRLGVFYAFLAGTGLRIGEATAVRYGWDGVHSGWSPATASVDVRTSLWRGWETEPKTLAGFRLVDLDPRLNELLVAYTAKQTLPAGAYLFQSLRGGPLQKSNVRRLSLKKLGIGGFHAFRRFRITRLRELGVPEDIIRYWAGHEGKSITDRYSKLAENIELRQRWAAQAGLGFDLPKLNKEKS